ncbi:MAG: tRNA-dihydrouridine synthase B [Candidatus Woesearchaeota archaeon]|jgi:tRNA-dihydrouridine synthase B
MNFFIREFPIYLAPMEAVNCASFRVLCKRRGASLVYTDMIDTDEFADYAREHGDEAAIKRYVNAQEEERPLVVQLGGANNANLAYTAKAVNGIADAVDFNVGCPLGSMLGKKGGCYLMKHPNQLEKVAKVLRECVTKPLSFKIRSGWDDASINAIEIATLLESCGADALTVHARTRKQLYKHKSDWQLVRKVKETVSIPVILSGDVFSPYDAYMAFTHTKCDGIMLARAAKHNPSVFLQMKDWSDAGQKKVEKPRNQYSKQEVDAIADFDEWLGLYQTLESRDRLSEIMDHARWTIREATNNGVLQDELVLCESVDAISEVVKKATF